jgi:hypothetical protein
MLLKLVKPENQQLPSFPFGCYTNPGAVARDDWVVRRSLSMAPQTFCIASGCARSSTSR